mmetsp:Transcript_62358/g.146366  ORF Transcript_62358/g.146366 Transcript_62358/m.146366 type:complete len:204 (+) Transcript_62358:203-814(+)
MSLVLTLQVVLHQQWGIRAKPERHRATQWCCLREVHQISQGEGCIHRLMDGQAHLVLGLLALARLQQDIPTTDVALHLEFQALLAAAQLQSFPKLLQVAADLLKLGGGQLRDDLVVLLRDLHVLTLDLHELQFELRDPVIRTLTLEAHDVRVDLVADLERIVRARHLQDLCQGVHVHPQGCRALALEVCECRLFQVQRDQGDM